MPLIEYEYVFSCSHSYSINAVGCLKPPLLPRSLPWLIRVRLICRGFLFDFVLCVLFFVLCLDFRSFSHVFSFSISHFHFQFQFSFNSFWCPLKQRALSPSGCKMRSAAAAAVGAASHPLGFPAFRLFSAESWLDIWLMMLTAREVGSEQRGEKKRRGANQHNGWRWSVGVVINTCLYMSLLQHAHWAPSRWKNKYSIEIKAHWMPHAIVSRWLNYRCAGEIFFLMKIRKHKELFTVIAFEVSQVDLVFN